MFKRPDPVLYDNGLETNIYEIAKQICSSPPKAPCTIQFNIEHEAEPEIETALIQDFTLACMSILFGPRSTPSDLSDKDFDLLKGYVNSVGYNILLETEEDEVSIKYHISFERYHSAKPNPFNHLKKYMH